MPVSLSRWVEITPSPEQRDAEIWRWLRGQLPDEDGWRAWVWATFVAPSGAVYYLDALILSPAGLFALTLVPLRGRIRSERGSAEHDGG